MRKAKKLCAVFSIFLLTGCAVPYSLVKSERITIGQKYSVNPQIAWSGKTINQVTLWTVNGSKLDRVVFLNNIQGGNTLFGDDKSPPFKKDMNIIEIAELFSNSMQTTGSWPKVKTTSLRIENFGPFEGFIFDTNMVSEKGLTYKGLVAGAIIDDGLYMAFFLAVDLHYYPKYIEHFRNMLRSIQKI